MLRYFCERGTGYVSYGSRAANSVKVNFGSFFASKFRRRIKGKHYILGVVPISKN